MDCYLTSNFKPKILSVGIAIPKHHYRQEEAAEALGYKAEKLKSVFLNSEINGRCFAVPLHIARNNRFADRNWLHETYIRESVALSTESVSKCLEKASLKLDDVGFLAFATCTGYSVPGLSAHIIKAMRMRKDMQRVDIYGMGCSAAVPAMHRAHDYVKMSFKRTALVIITEIYSTTIFREDAVETAVGDAIFADSSTAVLVGYGNNNVKPLPTIMDFETALDYDNIDALGYTFPDGRFRIRLDPKIPVLVAPLMERVASNLIERHGLSKRDIKAWIIHPGGKRILESAIKALELSDEQMKFTREMYSAYGNTAASGIVFVLDNVMNNGYMRRGDKGLVLTMGPGLTAEGMLLEWQ